MKVLVVSQYYPPENVPIPAAVARGLVDRGHQVRVITGYPNYPTGELFDEYRQRWRSREWDSGVDLRRVPIFLDHSTKALRRIANYASFAVSSSLAMGLARGADVVYVYATQMTAAVGPWLCRLAGGVPYVLHVQDLWPDSVMGSSLIGNNSQAKAAGSVLAPWLQSVYRHSTEVIAIAPTMARTLIDRGVDESKTHVVYNWAEAPGPASEVVEKASPSVNILYAGNVGDMQDLETAVRAAHDSHKDGVRLRIVGDGVSLPRLKRLCADLGAANVEFAGRVSSDEVRSHYADADLALVSLKDLPVFRGTIPSKFQAALAHSTPVITNVQGDLREIVTQLGIGLTAEAENVASLAAAFRRAAELSLDERRGLALKARAAYDSEFSLSAGVDVIEAVLQKASQFASVRRSSQFGGKTVPCQ